MDDDNPIAGIMRLITGEGSCGGTLDDPHGRGHSVEKAYAYVQCWINTGDTDILDKGIAELAMIRSMSDVKA